MSKYVVSYSAQYNKVCVYTFSNITNYEHHDIYEFIYKKDSVKLHTKVFNISKCTYETKMKALTKWFANTNNVTKSKKAYLRYLRRFYPEELL